MNENELKRKGKYMSLLLRHKPELEALDMDSQGYVAVTQLCSALKINREELDWIVQNNNKKRFEYKDYDKKIRATQGHSFKVDYGYIAIEPPDVLYHGTSWDNKEAIKKEGLKKMGRQHVHLTANIDTAIDVGMRYAKKKENLWLIEIDAKKMFNDGFVFYYTKNSVYLTDNVPSKYFIYDK